MSQDVYDQCAGTFSFDVNAESNEEALRIGMELLQNHHPEEESLEEYFAFHAPRIGMNLLHVQLQVMDTFDPREQADGVP